MKTRLLTLTLTAITALTTLAVADSPDAILKDYREKTAPAILKVNETLEKAAVPLVAALVKSGDTAGAAELQEQLKTKMAGEPVLKPQPTAVNLFKSYDAARAKALDPAQKTAIARIEALLASSDGKKMDIVTELGKVRAEIEAGKAVAVESLPFPGHWTYHRSLETKPMADMVFRSDGSWSLTDLGSPTIEAGTWKQVDKKTLSLDFKGVSWTIKLDGKTATVDRPDFGKRYLRVASN